MMKIQITFIVMAIAMTLGLQSCCTDCERIIYSNDFNFKAINLTTNDGNFTATSGTSVITVNWTMDITINGEKITVNGSKKSDELPVMAGDEIEINFTPSCAEQTEADFTLPDGSTHKASAGAPSFKWIVPDNFSAGMQIKGETQYKRDDHIYNKTGVITLISLEQ